MFAAAAAVLAASTALLPLAAAVPVAAAPAAGAAATSPNPAVAGGLARRQTYTGAATYYTQGGAAGSCGIYHADSDFICALGNAWMANQYQAPYCGDQIRITNEGGGQDNNGVGNTVTVTVADTCEACDQTHIDLSVGAFESLTGGPLDPPGTFTISWEFV